MGNLHGKNDKRNKKDTCIYGAIQQGNLCQLRRYLREESQVNLVDQEGTTPLILACELGHSEMVKLLLDADADPTAADNSKLTPLHQAAGGGHMKCCSQLLRTQASFMIDTQDLWGYTPLHRAVINQHDKVTELLLSHGCSVNLPDEKKRVPLHVAASYGNMSAVSVLSKHSALVNWPDDKGRTPLYFAVLGNHLNVVKQLVAGECNINQLTSKNVSVLKLAVHKGYVDCVHVLLLAGARICQTNTPEGNLLAHSLTLVQRDQVTKKAKDYAQIARLLLSATSGDQLSPLTFSLALQCLQDTNSPMFLLIIKLMFISGIPKTSLPPISNIAHSTVKQWMDGYGSYISLQDICRQFIRHMLVKGSGNVIGGIAKLELPRCLCDMILLNDVYSDVASEMEKQQM